MREHGIIFQDFSIPLIEAELKIQSRRRIRWVPGEDERKLVKVIGARRTFVTLDDVWGLTWVPHAGSAPQPWPAERIGEVCPYGGPGDRLWIKEAWRTWERPEDAVDGILYRADNAFVRIANTSAAADAWVVAHDNGFHGAAWRSIVHMPRWVSRYLLELTAVRPERVQSISDADAIAEGVRELPLQEGQPGAWWTLDRSAGPPLHGRSPAAAYAKAWDAIHGPGAWAKDEWVWVLGFKLLEVKR